MNSPSPEVAAVVDFLRDCLPFNELSEEQLAGVGRCIRISYLRAGSLLKPKEDDRSIRILRSGAIELREGSGQLLDRLAEGANFNLSGLAEDEPSIEARVIEDSLIYQLDGETHESVREANRSFDRFFHRQRTKRLRRAVRVTPASPVFMQSVADLMSGHLLSVLPGDSVTQAAQKMTERRVSSAVVVDQEGELLGILTDRDFRSRILAEGLDGQVLIQEIMTREPCAIHPSASAFDALLLMSEQGIHHLPVVSDGRAVGMVTTTDLIRARQYDPIYLVHDIARQESIEGITRITTALPSLLSQWVEAGARALQVTQVMTAAADAVTRRLITLAQMELGEAPVPFAWLGFGSQARREQILGADQDNALVISDTMQPEHEPYFKALAERVCTGLNECGYRFCSGEIMAMTERWRQPLSKWKQTVDGWARTPSPEAVMRVSIFFDVRRIEGDEALANELQQYMLQSVCSNDIFLAALTRNALTHTPPLGFFRRFVVERNGEHKSNLDLKHRGVIPIVDMVRVYALSAAITEAATEDRLAELAKKGVLTLRDARNLEDALEFIMQLRLKNQVDQLGRGERASNYLDPAGLADLSREQLRDAFSAVHDAQEALQMKFGRGYL